MNYGELKTLIARRLLRNDLSADIPLYITLGLSRIYYGFQDLDLKIDPLRIRSMIATNTTDLSVLPTDYLASKQLTINGQPNPLYYITEEDFDKLESTSQYPRFFTQMGGGFAVEGGLPITGTFALRFYQKYPALVNDTDTNWLLTNNPNIYLYSALVEAYWQLKDDNRVSSSSRMLAGLINAQQMADSAELHSGSTLAQYPQSVA